MAVEDDPGLDEFDHPDLPLSPEMHQTQAEMAAERGEDYEPYEFEARIEEWLADAPDPIEGAEPVEGMKDVFEEWMAIGDSAEP